MTATEAFIHLIKLAENRRRSLDAKGRGAGVSARALENGAADIAAMLIGADFIRQYSGCFPPEEMISVQAPEWCKKLGRMLKEEGIE